MNSKRKGSQGEREFALFCRQRGYEARRGVQFCGVNGDADVIGLPNIHIEVKRVEKLNIEDALFQSRKDSRFGEIPIVAHRKNNHKWLITMDAAQWFLLFKEWELSLPAGLSDRDMALYVEKIKEES
jgi:Holliday junction resolvase